MADSFKIARNTTYLTIASIFQKILSFIYFAFLAKIIGSEALGQYQSVLAFCGIFYIFMDFGLGAVLTREAAKEEEQLPNYFRQIFGAKMILIVVSVISLVATANILHYLKPNNYTAEDLFLIYVGTIVVLIDTLTYTFFCVFRALKKMQYEAFNIVIYQGVIFCVGIFGLIYIQQVLFLLLVLMAGSLFSFIYFLIIVKKKAHLYLTGTYTWNNFKGLMKIAIPFAITGIFVKLSGTIDIQMLKYMLANGNHYVGLYTLAFKLTFALTVLSGAFASSYFPSISYYIKYDIFRAKDTFEKGMAYMALLSLPITAGVLVLGDKIILTVWDERYFGSILPLKIYIASLLFIFLNYPVGNFLNAANKQTLNTYNTGITLLINIVLNILLIPKYNIIGAAIAAFISNTVLVLLGLPWVYKLLKFSWKNIMLKFIRLAVASIGMGLIVYFTQDYFAMVGNKWQLLISMIIGIISYIILLIITKGLTKQEFMNLRQALKK